MLRFLPWLWKVAQRDDTNCLVIIVIVVIIFGDEKLILFQERGHFLTNLGTDAQSGEHRQKYLKTIVRLCNEILDKAQAAF